MQSNPEVSSVFRRLAAVLEDELQLLSAKSFDELSSIIERKSRLLLEITRLGKHLPKDRPGAISEEAQRVIELLDQNQRALSSHLRAATSISHLIQSTISDQAWDGTYSPYHTAKR